MRWILFAMALGGASLALIRLPKNTNFAQAGTAVRMDVEDLVAAADRIVEARITGRRTAPDGRGRIVTEYTLLVRRTFLGDANGVQTVRIPGGVLENGRGLMLPGMPRISVGEEVLLFLNGDDTQMPTGLAQGKFRVMTDRAGQRRAVRSAGELELVHTTGHAAGHGGVQAFAYADLSARIQAGVAERESREAFGQPSEPTEPASNPANTSDR